MRLLLRQRSDTSSARNFLRRPSRGDTGMSRVMIWGNPQAGTQMISFLFPGLEVVAFPGVLLSL